MLREIRHYLIELKIFWQRGMSYLTIVNSSMILFLALSGLENYGFDLPIRILFIPLIILGLLGIILVGYLEDKAGLFRTEQELSQRRNPQINEILRRLDNIERELKKRK